MLSIWLSKLEKVIVFFFGMISGLGALLLRLFTRIFFKCSCDKEAFISKVLGHHVDGEDRTWNLCFHKDFHD